jgi:hypothetical protein
VLSLGAPRAYFAIRNTKKNYHFKAKSEAERREWMIALQEVGCEAGIARPPTPVYSPTEELSKSQEELIVAQFREPTNNSEPPEPPPFPSDSEEQFQPVNFRDSVPKPEERKEEPKYVPKGSPEADHVFAPKSKKVSGVALP